MTDADRPTFAEAMYLLGEMFHEPVSAVRAEAYFEALRELSLEQVNRAVRLALRGCRFFPKPVELRELLFGGADDNADLAWGELIREVRRVGYTGAPTFTNERTLRAVRETWGDWTRLCETLPGEGPELVGWMKQFKSTFQTLHRSDQTKSVTAGDLDPHVRAFIDRERSRVALTGASCNNLLAAPAPTTNEAPLDARLKLRRFKARVVAGR